VPWRVTCIVEFQSIVRTIRPTSQSLSVKIKCSITYQSLIKH